MGKNKSSFDTLLVAVDFTPFSKEAVIFASRLAGKLKANLIVLHVIHDPAEAPGFYAQKGKKKKYLKSMEEVAEDMMTTFMAKLRRAYPDEVPLKRATPKLVVGTPAARIVEVGKNEKAAMIIVGSHGRTGLEKIFLVPKRNESSVYHQYPSP